jgi:hypothetical protein
MPDDRYNGIDIELNLYERAGKWTGEYILIKRTESSALNEVNLLSKTCQTSEEARALALCEARRTIDRFAKTAPRLLEQFTRAMRA